MTKTTGDLITADDWNNLAVVPTGAIVAWSLASAPSGWLLCAGQEVSRATYADLFAAIGTTYGVGDGGTTFNLPDLRGRFPLGKDNMGGTSANRVTNAQADALGGGAGAEKHTLTTTEMPSHSHTVKIFKTVGGSRRQVDRNDSGTTETYDAADPTSSAGGGVAHTTTCRRTWP